MDIHSPEREPLPMAKIVHLDSDGTRLYIGEWCRALNITPARVSREAPINFGYLSGLISGKKTNPSRDKLESVARVLGLRVGQLYSAPPPARLIEQIAEHDLDTVIEIAKKRKSNK